MGPVRVLRMHTRDVSHAESRHAAPTNGGRNRTLRALIFPVHFQWTSVQSGRRPCELAPRARWSFGFDLPSLLYLEVQGGSSEAA